MERIGTVAILLTAVIVASDAAMAAAAPTPFVIESTFKDDPTVEFANAVGQALGGSPLFMAAGAPAGALRVVLPRGIRLAQQFGRPLSQFAVDFYSGQTKLGSSTGSCDPRNLPACSAIVLKDATSAAQKIR